MTPPKPIGFLVSPNFNLCRYERDAARIKARRKGLVAGKRAFEFRTLVEAQAAAATLAVMVPLPLGEWQVEAMYGSGI